MASPASSRPGGLLRHGWWISVLACLALMLVAGALHRRALAPVTDVTLLGPDGAASPVAFPYSAPAAPTDRPLEFAFRVRATSFTARSFVIVPDDHLVSISVNGVDESLAGVDPKKLDDYKAGFRFPLGREFRWGDNRVVVRVLNRGGGPGGLDVHPDPTDWRGELELVVAAGACLALLVLALRRAGCRWVTVALTVAGLGLRFAYSWVTPYSLRTHDVDGHIEYIQYLLDHHAVPKAADGYSFYHPPLYYAVSALAWRLLEAVGLSRDEILAYLQLQSMAFSMGFAAFAIATAGLWLEKLPPGALGRGPWSRPGLAGLFAALVLAWPSAVMHSVRIGNDDLTYLFVSAGIYYASRWWLHGGARNVNLAALAGALGVATKTNSLIVFIVLGGLLAARLAERLRERRPLLAWRAVKRSWLVLALLALSSGLALGRSVVETWSGRQDHVLVANASRNTTALVVGNHAENYLWFDLRVFVNQAFTSPWDDAKGRQFFWNYLLKTGLFGEWELAHPWVWNLAVVLSVLFLCVCAHAAVGTLVRPASEWYGELPLFLLGGGLVASLAALRMTLPSSCSGDFRYVLPVLVPCVWWFVRGLAAYRERGWRKAAVLGGVLGWGFAVVGAAFVVAVAATG